MAQAVQSTAGHQTAMSWDTTSATAMAASSACRATRMRTTSAQSVRWQGDVIRFSLPPPPPPPPPLQHPHLCLLYRRNVSCGHIYSTLTHGNELYFNCRPIRLLSNLA